MTRHASRLERLDDYHASAAARARMCWLLCRPRGGTFHHQYILITDAAKKSVKAATKAMARASAMLSSLLSFMLRSIHCMGGRQLLAASL